MIISNMESPEGIRTDYKFGSKDFIQAVAELKNTFPKLDEKNWYSISSPIFNKVFDDSVVTVVSKVHSPYLDHLDPILVTRKYLLNKQHIYEKVYTLLTNKTNTIQLPTGSNAIAKGTVVNVAGQPGDDIFTHYVDIYFSCKDHRLVETLAGTTLKVGKYSNYYCVTYDTRTNNLVKVKNYWYDEQNGLSDWDEYWVVQCKIRGLDPLTELS